MSMNSDPDYSLLESRFYIALGRYMQTFSYLDLNLGLCIRLLVNRNDVKAAHPLLERLSTQQKLDVLKELIFYKYANDKPKMISDFDKWFKKTSQTKASRNRYRELLKRRVSRDLAWNTAKSAHGPWRLSRSPGLAFALPAKYFSTLGLPRLFVKLT